MLRVAGDRPPYSRIPFRHPGGGTLAARSRALAVVGSLVVAGAAWAAMAGWSTVAAAASASVPTAETPGRTMFHPGWCDVRRQRCRWIGRLRRRHCCSHDGGPGIFVTVGRPA
jgi:hypothetical protein